MLRVGLTGDLGSGKSTVARMLAERGVVVFSSDAMGRAMMQPGEPVYEAVVEKFGPGVVLADGSLDRHELSRIAFADKRIEELNAIVHPAVIAEQQRLIADLAVSQPQAIVVVESALIFSTKHNVEGQRWSDRFDEILLVTAPENVKIARFIERASAGRELSPEGLAALTADAYRRLKEQRAGKAHEQDCIIIRNSGDIAALEARVTDVWRALQRMASRSREGVS
ncbi:MAG TPA: dephospho-CoA kinase [Acidobacteriaceae bacterium]|nr:dephospho-CoA kinase [Acidobacteriaceae bacterium]